jgi:pimeloyl-ACP methyl ester carboxylesterase
MSAYRPAGSLTGVAYVTVMTLATLAAQVDLPATRMVSVDGRMMQVRTAEIDSRKAGTPILVLEAGAGATLDTWDQAFADLARLAPVVAYDRRSHGRSEADTVPQTIKRDIENLRALLQSLSLGPPYVLVGHSWGGVLIRGFAHTYPSDVGGLVYLDVPDFESTREEKAAVLPPEDRKRALEPPTFPPIPPDTPPGLRRAFEELMNETRDDYPIARSFKQPPGIPSAVVVTTRAGRLEGNGAPIVRLHIKKQQEWALASPNGLFVLAGHSGHQVQRNDPALVAHLVSHVLKYARPK